jgi:hypothetical protein
MDMQATTAPAPTDRWRIYVVCYLLWIVAFAVVEGAGRKACNMPMQKWIAAAGSPRDRTAREWFRDRANECLDRTPWYSYSMVALITIGLVGPFAVASTNRKQLARAALSLRIKTTEVLYGAVIVIALAVTLGTMEAVRWIYDWLG